MQIDVYADVVCPWCYIGKRNLELALQSLGELAEVTVRHRSFELQPDAPTVPVPTLAYLGARYGGGADGARKMMAQVTGRAATVGLEYHLEHTESGPTMDAHRLLKLASDRGLERELLESLFAAYFTEQRSIYDHDELTAIAVSTGLDAQEVTALLNSDDYADAVRADHVKARSLGITGVPFFVIDGRYGVSGAQPAEVLAEVIADALEELGDGAAVTTAAG